MKRVFVAGHEGMVGSAIARQLTLHNLELVTRTRSELDLTDQHAVRQFFESEAIDQVYLCAAKVGGISANNSFPADFIYNNLMIQANVIHASYCADVERLLFLGSSCIYPAQTSQPMREDALLSSELESTNEPYAIAKIAGLKLCESYNRQHNTDFRSVMPTNLYGPNDNFQGENSHVIPALLRRFHEAKVQGADVVYAWGSGLPRREFLHVDDMASACIYIMDLDKNLYASYTKPMLSHVNIGTGKDCTIRELVELIANVVGYSGRIEFDTTKPDGTPRKLLDINKLSKLGWGYKIELECGLRSTYEWFLQNQNVVRKT